MSILWADRVIAPLGDTIVGKLHQKEQLRRKHVCKSQVSLVQSNLTFDLLFHYASTAHSVTTLTRALDGRPAPCVVAPGWPRKRRKFWMHPIVGCVWHSKVEYDPIPPLPKASWLALPKGYFAQVLDPLGTRGLFASSFQRESDSRVR